MKTFKIYKYCLVLLALSLGSCEKDYLEPEVTDNLETELNINTVSDLQGLVLGAYDRMNYYTYYGRDYVVFAEVRSDNAFSSGNSGRFTGPAQFFLNATDAYPTDTWSRIYQVISNANLVIQSEVEDNESVEVKYTKGQAYAIRALAHMDLLRLYGQQWSGGNLGVPYITTYTDGNSELTEDVLYPSRATVDETWAKIGEDFQTALSMMDPSLDESTPTKISTWAVYALQSRYYLYTEDYAKAAEAAKKVIDSKQFSVVDAGSYTSAWGGAAANSVFELALTDADNNGSNGLSYMYNEGNYGDVEVTQDLYNTYAKNDVRLYLYSKKYDAAEKDTTYRMVGKYSEYSDNIKVIRYEEVILNYTEALAHLGSSEALTYLNMIPSNRNAAEYTAATLENVLTERRKELAMEGHRFFDLVRNEKDIPYVDSRQTYSKSGVAYGSSVLAFPIPRKEIDANPNIEQNADY
ncbi:RagB/SusD family nutrient uptake outer membrane protein [Pontibacter silvestris]|uniref:RagB/SusD family nutrient uptake outer membrane protein n=1 Tax=Pontibacter silvestris TaxID=2305183 RepID=A0ABW4WZH0_9BACT|nr:RagB/SusD family nutrient uptake outer membrane protein [Pontibacter silvestris]MCC9135661.1 RagB/SusD family nutrient uptake outer membrane protein [Pontibacter silvestris]